MNKQPNDNFEELEELIETLIQVKENVVQLDLLRDTCNPQFSSFLKKVNEIIKQINETFPGIRLMINETSLELGLKLSFNNQEISITEKALKSNLKGIRQIKPFIKPDFIISISSSTSGSGRFEDAARVYSNKR